MKHLVAIIIISISVVVIALALVFKPWNKTQHSLTQKNIQPVISPTITPTPIPTLIPCNTYDLVNNKLREMLPTYKPKAVTENTVRIAGVIWKKTADTPYIRYTASAGMILKAPDDDVIPFSTVIYSGLEHYLLENGYKVDITNTYGDRTGHLSLSTLGNYAFKKDNELFTITYNSLGGGAVTFMCARQDQQKDHVYTDLLSMKPLPTAWSDIDNSTVIDIWEIHDAVVYLQVETLGAGSYGQYWYKDNYGWTKLYEGQTLPSCGLFEEKNTGHGLECTDCTDQKTGCIIRKTH